MNRSSRILDPAFGMVRQSIFSFPFLLLGSRKNYIDLCVDYRYDVRVISTSVRIILVDQRTDSKEEFKRQYFVLSLIIYYRLSITLALLSINGFDEN